MLREASARQPLPGEKMLGLSLTRVAARSSEFSAVSDCGLPGMGIAAVGDSLRDSAASAWMSSEVARWLPDGRFIEARLVLDGARFIERTTSPLQIGHVRRRVVNHGVLHIR